MTAMPPPQPRSATYGAGALFAAGVGLLAIFALLAGLSVVVRDANARETERRVVPGKISVVGAAKLRRWSSDRFSVKIPAGWRNIATGPATVQGAESPGQIDVHRWQSSLDEPRTAGECDPGLRCLEIRLEERSVSGTKTPQQFATKTSGQLVGTRGRAPGARVEQFVDLGPVEGPRGRWMWRMLTDRGADRRARYLFATCRDEQTDRFWTVSLFAPALDDVSGDLDDILGSLELDRKTPPRPTKVQRSGRDDAARGSQDSDCRGVVDDLD